MREKEGEGGESRRKWYICLLRYGYNLKKRVTLLENWTGKKIECMDGEGETREREY